ncbi:MAG: hypothetical protein AB1938_16335 [Myxococcota bacterium]
MTRLVVLVVAGALSAFAAPPARPEAPTPQAPSAPVAIASAPAADAPRPSDPAPAAPQPQTPPRGEKPRLVVLDLSAAGDVDPDTARSMTEVVAAQATRAGVFEVTTQKDVATLLSLERQKQLLGCSDEAASCMAELAGAMGARFVLSGSLTRLGADTWQLTLQMLDTASTRTVGRSTRIAGDLDSLRGTVPWAFAEATATPAPPVPSKGLPITLMASGGAAVVGGGVLLLMSWQREDAAVRELELSASQPQVQIKDAAYYEAEASTVRTMRIIGGLLTGLGAAALVTGIVLMSTAEGGGTRVALVPAPGGIGLAGVFP